MKKSGVVSFVIYLLYTLCGLGLVIYSLIAIDNHTESGEAFEGLGYALLLILGIIFGAAGLVATILKLIHMGSGWGFFGFLCILADLVFIFAWISMAAPGGNLEQIEMKDLLPSIPFILASLVSMVANIKSLSE